MNLKAWFVHWIHRHLYFTQCSSFIDESWYIVFLMNDLQFVAHFICQLIVLKSVKCIIIFMWHNLLRLSSLRTKIKLFKSSPSFVLSKLVVLVHRKQISSPSNVCYRQSLIQMYNHDHTNICERKVALCFWYWEMLFIQSNMKQIVTSRFIMDIRIL